MRLEKKSISIIVAPGRINQPLACFQVFPVSTTTGQTRGYLASDPSLQPPDVDTITLFYG